MAQYVVVECAVIYDGLYDLEDLQHETIKRMFDMPPNEELTVTERANVVLVERENYPDNFLVLVRQ